MGPDPLAEWIRTTHLKRLDKWAADRYPNDVVSQVRFLNSLSSWDIGKALGCTEQESAYCYNYLKGR